MREIKFRAWNTQLKRIYGWNYLMCGYGLKALFREPELHALELMQYTGLKDKNGKEIYEGDVAKDGKMLLKCGWNKCQHRWSWYKIKNDNIWCHLGEGFCQSEVIGNIYENAELTAESEAGNEQ